MFNDTVIERVKEYRCLGTVINHKLDFNTNTRNIIDEANKRFFIMKQLAYMNAETSTMRLANTTFVESVLQYHLMHHIWTPHI